MSGKYSSYIDSMRKYVKTCQSKKKQSIEKKKQSIAKIMLHKIHKNMIISSL